MKIQNNAGAVRAANYITAHGSLYGYAVLPTTNRRRRNVRRHTHSYAPAVKPYAPLAGFPEALVPESGTDAVRLAGAAVLFTGARKGFWNWQYVGVGLVRRLAIYQHKAHRRALCQALSMIRPAIQWERANR